MVRSPNVPPHLRRFVVEQDYAAYDAGDHAVWRLVLGKLSAQLRDSAHPAYAAGLASTGISLDRIPNIAEMNDRLGRFGWGAVCVDGFIPPRAFQEFQASGILPIAADIRTREHIAYTPAPDILHEAAGHAPILPDPIFSAYLRRLGTLGRGAFTRPEEARVDDAIRTLSRVKEDPSASPEAAAAAEAELEAARAGATMTSEAARLSRLYWWTAEYGLVGRINAYTIYGAGLLSSLGESESCRDPGVRKAPLDEHCVHVSYDITRPQPQLFVARDFDALHEVLGRVAATLASERGGPAALAAALESCELASVQFASGIWAIGTLRAVGPRLSAPGWLELGGSVALALDGLLMPESSFARHTVQYVLTGPLEDGTALEHASQTLLNRLLDPTTGVHRFGFASGASVEGRLWRVARRADGRVIFVELRPATLRLPGAPPRELADYVLLAAGSVVTAHAGAVDPSYHGDTPFSSLRFPTPRIRPLDAPASPATE